MSGVTNSNTYTASRGRPSGRPQSETGTETWTEDESGTEDPGSQGRQRLRFQGQGGRDVGVPDSDGPGSGEANFLRALIAGLSRFRPPYRGSSR